MINIESIDVNPNIHRDIASLPLSRRVATINHRDIENIGSSQPRVWDPYIEADYHVKEDAPLNSDTIRFARSYYDIFFKEEEINAAKARLTRESQLHLQRKTDIRAGLYGGRKKEKKVQEAAVQWEIVKTDIGADVLAETVLRDTMLDMLVRDHFSTLGGIGKLLNGVSELSERKANIESNDEYQPATTIAINPKTTAELLTKTAKRIHDAPHTSEQASFWRYKTGSENVCGESANVITQLVVTGFSEKPSNDVMGRGITSVSKELLEYYWDNAIMGILPEQVNGSEPFPISAFVYDFLYATVNTRDVAVVKNAGQWLVDRIMQHKDQFFTELTALQKQSSKASQQLCEFVALKYETDVPAALRGGMRIEDYMLARQQELVISWHRDHNVDDAVVVDRDFDRASGFGTLFELLTEYGLPNLSRQFTESQVKRLTGDSDIMAAIDREHKPSVYGLSPFQIGLSWKRLHANVLAGTAADLDSFASAMMSKDTYLKRLQPLSERTRMFPVEPQSAKSSFFVNVFHEGLIDQGNGMIRYDFAGLQMCFTDIAPQNQQELLARQKVVESLGYKIRNQNAWLVAPNGDIFMGQDNEELRQHHIETLLFKPDRQIQGTRVTIKTDVLDKTTNKPVEIVLYIDRFNKFYTRNFQRIETAVWLTSTYEAFILRYLDFVTAANRRPINEPVSKRRGEEETPEESADTKIRRPHWRRLQGEQYNLQSWDAQHHDELIQRIYGIPIYQMNIEWHRNGMPLDNWRTLVREFQARDTQKAPNRMVYKEN